MYIRVCVCVCVCVGRPIRFDRPTGSREGSRKNHRYTIRQRTWCRSPLSIASPASIHERGRSNSSSWFFSGGCGRGRSILFFFLHHPGSRSDGIESIIIYPPNNAAYYVLGTHSRRTLLPNTSRCHRQSDWVCSDSSRVLFRP